MPYLISVTGKSEVFFDAGGDNQQPRIHMGGCDGNFEMSKVIDDATTIEVKVESYTLSTTKDSMHAMTTMIVAMYSMLHMHQKLLRQSFYAKLFVRDRWWNKMLMQSFNIISETC